MTRVDLIRRLTSETPRKGHIIRLGAMNLATLRQFARLDHSPITQSADGKGFEVYFQCDDGRVRVIFSQPTGHGDECANVVAMLVD